MPNIQYTFLLGIIVKKTLPYSVYVAAVKRITTLFDDFSHCYVSFSGGKDSGVLLHLTLEIAKKKNRLPLDVLFVDMEAQYAHTIKFVEEMIERGDINAWWVCLPLSLRNAASQYQPKWICWEPEKEKSWTRPLPESQSVISDYHYFDFYHYGMEFEDFMLGFNQWYVDRHQGLCSALIAIRSDESLHRYTTVKNKYKKHHKTWLWTTEEKGIYKSYPIYDWKTRDIWIANSLFNWSYNIIYDLMYQAGVPLSQQRLCQPFGDDQRRGLWLFHVLEPHTWEKLVARVEGCNFSARYSKTQGHILGYRQFILPSGHTYRSYSYFLLASMPPELATHYRARIAQFIWWWHGKGLRQIPDASDKKQEQLKKVPSWRRICKVLIKNDFWCVGLSFGKNKSVSAHYTDLYSTYLGKTHYARKNHSIIDVCKQR
ncbi:DUF3440 domain-containing protein [Photobacterium indicum]|uniref:DUF3440 domain-containing protein n=1 Tax=Photobacterium indicum TaxID=81447 RepID=UPI003D105EEA